MYNDGSSVIVFWVHLFFDITFHMKQYHQQSKSRNWHPVRFIETSWERPRPCAWFIFIALESYGWCDNNDCLWAFCCMWGVQYSLDVTGPIGHSDSFLWDGRWLQPMAGLCVLRPHTHTRHAFLIVRVQMGCEQYKYEKCHLFEWDMTPQWLLLTLQISSPQIFPELFVVIMNWSLQTSNTASNRSRVWRRVSAWFFFSHWLRWIMVLYNAIGSYTGDIWWKALPMA